MARPVYAVFVAGGTGSRMGSQMPKQFMELRGVPILERSIERFLDAAPDAVVVTVLPDKHVSTWREICLKRGLSFPQIIVKGGMTRFHSVKNALWRVPDGAIVSIHDGVRPLVSETLIHRMIGMMQMMEDASAEVAFGVSAVRPGKAVGLIPVVPVVDTLRSVAPGVPPPDRNTLVAVQTPQMFLSEVLKKAYNQPYDMSFTDDASVVEHAGYSVAAVPGERFNIKITTPDDMKLAELLLRGSSS